ncbi:TPA: hypothetical protein HA363_07020 [Candidatus Woesearchaeota archaeon]|nr:hypothetical protein [Candidatus Woesearchaeota archaeon]
MNRIYSEYNVSDLTLEEVHDLMQDEQAHYAADYGLEFKELTTLKISQN